MKFLHDFSILHTHLSSEHVILGEDGAVKVLSVQVESVTEARPVESEPKAVFENYFEAPEIIANEPLSEASDIWSLGVLLYQLACLRVPCAHSTPEELL